MTAPPLMMPDRVAEPVAAPTPYATPVAEPVLAADAAEEEQPDLYAAPVAAVPAPEPVVSSSR